MGSIQLEILREQVRSRFSQEITFGPCRVIYQETIAAPVEGRGHFEPLRHYAEVHLRLEPGERGSGIQFESQCSTDSLALNWQRLIETHVYEKEHKGVLTGSPITDIKVVLLAGRSHEKHTEGGDFREAVYRAIRQGLMKAQSVLLEPWYGFTGGGSHETTGRFLSDIQHMGGEFEIPETLSEDFCYQREGAGRDNDRLSAGADVLYSWDRLSVAVVLRVRALRTGRKSPCLYWI